MSWSEVGLGLCLLAVVISVLYALVEVDTPKKPVHEWGPWMQKSNIYGELLNYAERRCAIPGCGYESAPLVSLHELAAMSRRERRKR